MLKLIHVEKDGQDVETIHTPNYPTLLITNDKSSNKKVLMNPIQ